MMRHSIVLAGLLATVGISNFLPACAEAPVVNVNRFHEDFRPVSSQLRDKIDLIQPPKVGETRGAIESRLGPAQNTMAPNKPYTIFTNDQTPEGKPRLLNPDRMWVYQVTFSPSITPQPTDKATAVERRYLPRVGDHRNLVNKLLGADLGRPMGSQKEVWYPIPKHQMLNFNDVLDTPRPWLKLKFDEQSMLTSQTFVDAPSEYQPYLSY